MVPDKIDRVASFHGATIESLAELTAAAGLDHPQEFTLAHLSRRISPSEVASFAELYPSLPEGALIAGTANPRWRKPWDMASASSFRALA